MSDMINTVFHDGITEISPRSAGFNPLKLEQLDELYAKLIKENKLQCAGYLISRRGKILAHRTMGKLCGYDNRGDYMPDSIRRIASITKVFTSIAILRLIEDGMLDLHQPVASIISEFDNNLHRDITVFHLLTHTSGLCADPGYLRESYLMNWWDLKKERNWIEGILSGPILCRPGQNWNYSSSCFQLLGEIITRVSGIYCEDYIIETIIKPLGMENTFFDVPDEYYDKACLIGEGEEKRLKSGHIPGVHPPRTRGGLYSNLLDLWKLGQMLLNKGTFNNHHILGKKTVELMTRNHLNGVFAPHWGDNIQDFEYGLGVQVTSRDLFLSPGTYFHEGGGRSCLYIDPVEELIAVTFVPTTINWLPESVKTPLTLIWSGIIN